LCVSAKTASCCFTSRQSVSASSSVVVIGLSHTTWNPASRKARAIAKCDAFGVTMLTKSMRCPSGRLRSASAISFQDP
jgi:hypothetical protein